MVVSGGVWQPGRVHLSWPEGHYLHGLEITMRRRSMGDVLDIWEREEATPARDAPLAERAPAMRRSAEDLAALILDWNATDEASEPVPVTGPGLLTVLSFDDVQDVWDAYQNATSRVAPPLPSNSDGGQPSEEQALQLPTEPMSDSPPSSPPS